ncbi:MAG: SH3 domain-containing protein [Spirochaetota bacterium]
MRSEFGSPAFWAAKLPDPDRLLLSPEGIDRLNNGIRNSFLSIADPLALDARSSAEIEAAITGCGGLPDEAWCRGEALSPEEREALRASLDLGKVRAFSGNCYGITVRRADLRALPTRRAIHEAATGYDEIDLLQHCALDPATPLAILHESRDGQWLFCIAPFYAGWLHRNDVALCDSPGTLGQALEHGRSLIVTASWHPLAVDGEEVLFQMGARIPCEGGAADAPALLLPRRGADGALQWRRIASAGSGNGLSPGFLPFTQANVLEQAFKMLDEPYAWGDSCGGRRGRDCSRLVQDIFKTMGVILPRNGGQQASCLSTVLEFPSGEDFPTRLARLQALGSPLCLLRMPGHILLHLGQEKGMSYAFHSLWSYGGDFANRTIVSPLDMGIGTESGPILLRMSRTVGWTDRLAGYI